MAETTMRSRRPALAGLAGLAICAMAWLGILALNGSVPALAQETDGQSAPPTGDPVAGKRLYRTGIGHDGRPVTALTQGDIPVSGDQFPCTSCHRRSGMGTTEGGRYVPPIAVPYLFAPREANVILRLERFKEYFKELQPKSFYDDLKKPRLRPAYDDETLKTAITEGSDPVGRPLDPTMPRYRLDAEDLANLVAYLHTLSARPDPGVTDREIHYATIAAESAGKDAVEAYEKLVDAYADWFNRDVTNDLAHPGYSPYYRSDFLYTRRKWVVHHWRLKGDPSGWRAQLDAAYERQPVFAVFGGLVDGPFAPVDAFCNARELPCIFPYTELPPEKDPRGGDVLYMSRGLLAEANGLATWLVDRATGAATANAGARPPAHIRVLHADDVLGNGAASAFGKRMARLLPADRVEEQAFRGGRDFARQLRKALKSDADALVIWPGRKKAAVARVLATADVPDSLSMPIIVSSGIVPAFKASGAPDAKLAEHLRIIWPYDKPTVIHPDSYRARAWVRTRRLPIPDWNMIRQTFFALRLTDNAMEPLQADYYRDYLVEILEHITEVGFDPGPYPRPALGPDQRVATKGIYVMRWDDQAPGHLVAVSDWIVPAR
ncbi:MAG: hypothetical protein D6757_01710 [Alphaproteobacteria bacterium]|nr:MAG: hypothetical protein D6757_01710 [Alphaproteobacteria bacterium]